MIVRSAALFGFEAREVEIEVRAEPGYGALTIAGIPPAAERETRVRVVSALASVGASELDRWVKVNVRAALPRGSAPLDLAIALGILAEIGEVPREPFDETVFIGELGFDGSVRPARGVLPMLESSPKNRGFWVPYENSFEAALSRRIASPIRSLREAVDLLNGKGRTVSVGSFELRVVSGLSQKEHVPPLPEDVLRAVTEAVDARKNFLLVGPPGSGKTMLARWVRSMMPPMNESEALDVVRVQSIAGMYSPTYELVRPFRAPHHTVSEAGLCGSADRPGEVHLAARGVLFLDELSEFRRGALDALDRVLGFRVTTPALSPSPSRRRHPFASAPLLIGAVNPCPCGFRGHPRRRCACAPAAVERYWERMKGKLFERFVERVEVSSA